MKQETYDVVRSILAADETVSKDKLESVLRNLRQTTAPHRHLIGAKQTMQMLGNISRPTLRSYVKQGFISQISFSSRKVRFDEEQIRNFADNGAPHPPSVRTNQNFTTPQPANSGTNEMDGF